jgi:hypothetical protein
MERLQEDNLALRSAIGANADAPISDIVVKRDGSFVLVETERERQKWVLKLEGVQAAAASEQSNAATRIASLEGECDELRKQVEKHQSVILSLASEKASLTNEIVQMSKRAREPLPSGDRHSTLQNQMTVLSDRFLMQAQHVALEGMSAVATAGKLLAESLMECLSRRDASALLREAPPRAESHLRSASSSSRQEATLRVEALIASRSASVTTEASHELPPALGPGVSDNGRPSSRKLSLTDIASGGMEPPSMVILAAGQETLRELAAADDADALRSLPSTAGALPAVAVVAGMHLHEHAGAVIISEVEPDSPAYLAGLKDSDCILSVDGVVVNSVIEFREALSSGPRSAVSLTVVPGGGREIVRSGSLAADAAIHVEEVQLLLM